MQPSSKSPGIPPVIARIAADASLSPMITVPVANELLPASRVEVNIDQVQPIAALARLTSRSAPPAHRANRSRRRPRRARRRGSQAGMRGASRGASRASTDTSSTYARSADAGRERSRRAAGADAQQASVRDEQAQHDGCQRDDSE